jgi:1-acyl-sn-glycerol-3-phosphate acyltransferase
MIAAFIAMAARVIAGGSTRWFEEPADKGQRVYFANHSSHLDFVLVWAALPPRLRGRTRPVAARDYWERGPIRRYLAANTFRAVLIDRLPAAENDERSAAERGRKAVAKMVTGLGSVDSLILFPEGTRGSGQGLGPFKSGLYHLCRERPDLELVPVYIENLNRILPKGEFVPVPMISRITFGRSIRLEDGEPKDAFLERARVSIELLESS